MPNCLAFCISVVIQGCMKVRPGCHLRHSAQILTIPFHIVRMEGLRQRRLGSKQDHSTTKVNYKADLTLTGPLMERLGQTLDDFSVNLINIYQNACARPGSAIDRCVGQPRRKS